VDIDFSTSFHEYAVEYGGDSIKFFVDGVAYNNISSDNASMFDVPYYMILDTSVGSTRAGPPDETTVFPNYHYIDYVHVAQKA